MKLELTRDPETTQVLVTLSRRNLLALLHKVSLRGSAAMLISRNAYRQGELVDDIVLVVRAENDHEHYSGRGFAPGAMQPLTEAFLALADGAAASTRPPGGGTNGGTTGESDGRTHGDSG